MNETSISLDAHRLARDVAGGLAVLEKAETAVDFAGPGAHAFTRISIHVQAKAEVDAIAAEWGVTAKWDHDGALYVARSGNTSSEAEAVFIGSEAQATA